MTAAEQMTEEQRHAVYDRQIRLWGAEAQNRIGASRALIWGLGGANVETVKNLVLAGISVTLVDDRAPTEADLGVNFFLREADLAGDPEKKTVAAACRDRVAELNPFGSVDVAHTADLVVAVAAHGLVVAERLDNAAATWDLLGAVSKAARETAVPFFYARVDADKGLFFVDHGAHHTYKPDASSSSKTGDDGTTTTKTARFAAFHEVYAAQDSSVSWSSIATKRQPAPTAYFLDRLDRDFSSLDETTDRRSYAEFAAARAAERGVAVDATAAARHDGLRGAAVAFVGAVVGGVLGQECIKAISRQGEPLDNLFIFDTATDAGVVYRVGPPSVVGQTAASSGAVKRPPDGDASAEHQAAKKAKTTTTVEDTAAAAAVVDVDGGATTAEMPAVVDLLDDDDDD